MSSSSRLGFLQSKSCQTSIILFSGSVAGFWLEKKIKVKYLGFCMMIP